MTDAECSWLSLPFVIAVTASTKAAPMHSQAFAPPLSSLFTLPKPCKRTILLFPKRNRSFRQPRSTALCPRWRSLAISAALSPLDLTEENIRQVLVDARSEFGQLFDASVGITGEVDLAELDGPFVKIRLKGRFWHKRSTVLDRISNYLKNRIP
ncbi:uncharacterized protein LOC121988398 isoform X2 [Zingiber officinale]|nr:uncharacterized protein LOC121988398 isoform X2 [Zingiber officinale]